MKTYIFCKLWLVLLFFGFSIILSAQFEQNIYNTNGMVSDSISVIDSIRFDADGDMMWVVTQSGDSMSYLLGAIDSVTFAPLMSPDAHLCGLPNIHNVALTYGNLTDQDGNSYKTIVIGNHEWMAENLKSAHFVNGDEIPFVVDNLTWQSLTSGACSWWNNDSASYDCPYGRLYNWYAVADARNICPTGWHVPGDNELMDLENMLGGLPVAGGKMKSQDTLYWNAPNTSADNSSGFSALPGGHRLDIGAFGSVGDGCYLWSSTPNDTLSATYHFIAFNLSNIIVSSSNKTVGFSVRCVHD